MDDDNGRSAAVGVIAVDAPTQTIRLRVVGLRVSGAAGMDAEGGANVTTVAQTTAPLGTVTLGIEGARRLRADLDDAIRALEQAE